MARQHREKASQQKSSVSFYPDEEEQQRQGRHLANTHGSTYGGYVAALLRTERSPQGTAPGMCWMNSASTKTLSQPQRKHPISRSGAWLHKKKLLASSRPRGKVSSMGFPPGQEIDSQRKIFTESRELWQLIFKSLDVGYCDERELW